MGTYFDVIEFLGVSSLPRARVDKLRPLVLGDLSSFLLSKFVDELTEEQLESVRKQMRGLKNYEEVMSLIYRFDPEFERKKIGWLAEYKAGFMVEKFEKQ